MGGILDVSDAALDEHGGRVQLNLNRNWGSSQRLSFLGGAEIRQGHSASHSSRAYGYDDNFLTYNNIDYLNQYPIYGSLSSAQRIASGIGYGDVTNRFVSLFSTGSYNLHDRYTVTASARKDASNLFGVRTNQKAVPLWSTGVAWSIAHEKFYGIKLLPLLKLRASYGYSGNVDNSRSAFAVIEYSTAPDPLTNQPFATIPAPPNPELRWEKVGILNLGIDFGFINNRISGSIEYYRKKANDLLASAPTDPTTGFTSLVLNSAVIKGRGIELQLQTINTTGIVKWSSVLLFSYTRNILDRYLPAIGTARSYAGAGTTFNPAVGKDAYALFSYRWAGLDPLTGEPQGYLNGQVSKNYTAIRNESLGSLVYHGSAAPIYSGAFRNTISWNQFSVSANIIFKLGYWFRRSSINYSSLASSWTTHSDYAMRWQKPGDEVHTSVPAFIYPLNSVRDEFYSFSEVLAERADHVRLKDIRLSYTYSDSATKLKWLKGGSVFLYADNIGLLWKANKHGLDPDYFSSGLPAPRSISMGINVAF
ncbi:MAG: TonB-dependent receptor [Chitinophagaceae bacterium]|nr:TonB-dependent receptor [Chitinophagaceae bacterium]